MIQFDVDADHSGDVCWIYSVVGDLVRVVLEIRSRHRALSGSDRDAGSPAYSLRTAQGGSIVVLDTRATYLRAAFAMTRGSYKEVREFLAASSLAVNEIRQRPAVAGLMELQYVTPPVPLNGARVPQTGERMTLNDGRCA